MLKASIDVDGAIEVRDDLSSKRELYIRGKSVVTFEVETVDERAYPVFNQMPESTLPILPPGYMWVKHEGKYGIIREDNSYDYDFNLILYGPNSRGQINFLFQIDGVTTYSFAHVTKESGPTRLKPPMDYSDYRVPGYQYAGKKYPQHVFGHLIDLRDTIMIGPSHLWSANDRRNFIPEPPVYEWGLGIRNQKVQALRRLVAQTAYAQYSIYGHSPMRTANDTPVPEEVLFTSFFVQGNTYQSFDVLNVNWEENMKRPRGQKILEHAAVNLTSSLEASPVVQLYDHNDTDRGLRYKSRNFQKQAAAIEDGSIHSRFPLTAAFYAQFGAADREFERVDKQLKAGITADNAGQIPDAIQGIERSLTYGEELQSLDEADEIVNGTVRRESLDFLQTKAEDEAWGHQDLDDLTDRLNSLFRI